MISGHGLFLVCVSLLAAWVLAWVPLPGLWAFGRPDLVALIILYWAYRHPDRIGVLAAWGMGLVTDLMLGTHLGTHAMAYAIMTYFLLNVQHRFRLYGMLQQSLVVFLLTGIAIMVRHWINQLTGVPARDLMFMLGAFGSALFWPFVRYTLDYMGGRTL
ncbi:rod shape-determining protein MreD [Hahella sp. SMD15-11]|uniref:Rod shape-determining protein MreD n=1 Tax=Thermohahella caldifontis TaxID=3142973 RepID=A0AB39V071_9GAMM